MEVESTLRWTDADVGGEKLKSVGMDTDGAVYVVAGGRLYRVSAGLSEAEATTTGDTAAAAAAAAGGSGSGGGGEAAPAPAPTPDAEAKDSGDLPEGWKPLMQVGDGSVDDVVYSVDFSSRGQVLVSTKSNGLELYSSPHPESATRQAHLPDFRGPVSLSHPSSSAIGVDLSDPDKEYGQFTALDVKEDDLVHKAVDLWKKDMAWFSTLEPRGECMSLRRCWYGSGQQMLYFVDALSAATPEDGVRSLHLRGSVAHTYMSMPVPKDVPFRIEVPHMASGGELLVVTPDRVTFENGKEVCTLPGRDGSHGDIQSLWTATDMQGKWGERKGYAIGFTAVTNDGTRHNTVHVLKAVHK